MSPERKALKIVCFLYVLDALACVAAGVLALAGAGALPGDAAVAVGGVELALRPCSVALGVLLIGSGVLYLALSGAGIRGANRPRQIGGLLTLARVALAAGAADVALGAACLSGAGFWPGALAGLASLALAVACLVLGSKVARQAQR